MHITSQNNPSVRLAMSLALKKQRDATGLFLVEGPNMIREALLQGFAFQTLFFSKEAMERPRGQELHLIQSSANDAKTCPDMLVLDAAAFKKVSQTETSQGIAGIAKKRYSTEQDLFFSQGSNVLVLDRIQDPGNIGTLLRTAEAAGFTGVLFMKGCGDPYGPKAVRAASGALLRLPFIFVDEDAAAIEMLKRNKKRLFVTTADATRAYYDCDIASDAAIVIGNEGNGVSQVWNDGADMRLAIPMAGQAESLNAALAGGIIMYEAFRQKQAALHRIDGGRTKHD